MRIPACLLLILGALVLVWGLGDLWNLLTIWREAVSRYGGEPSLLRLGGAQLAACEAWAKRMGCREFASDCLLKNEDSLRFHTAVGFRQVNRIICFAKKL